MIDVTGLSKTFRGRSGDNTVLDGVDLHVGRGEVVAIIGPSGSGKSTLLRCLNLLESPDSGTIEIDGASVTAPRIPREQVRALRSKTAMVFQSYHLFRNRTALQNVMDPLTAKGVATADAEREARELLERVGIVGATQTQFPVTLSGGQQQRVSIARALAVHPAAILLDEPTSALDPELVGEVLAVIRDLADREITLVIVTHEMAFAADVADRVVFIDEGRIVEEGPARQVIREPREERTRRFLREHATGGVSRPTGSDESGFDGRGSGPQGASPLDPQGLPG
ncbi:amino acid ABC transporter ATP-binding protein [Brachybacterium sp. J153]|uniref:amino acid ABC transporter ATP-binding protein n=1 Tax=Brachybacterium sp. J153 TaxID=3116488 RepID=UPI002E78A236|nr:amino acid ABC transporter ATP-binding protein [Brachybacterium sp. J153]MEE1617817.1 amino acid ABC transporter ATP-binding protein [Brachybacterium sp. J153]